MRIENILEEIRQDKIHSKEDIVFFLQEVISLYEDYDGLAECLQYIIECLKENGNSEYKEYLVLTEVFSKLCLEKKSKMLLQEQEEIEEAEKVLRREQELYLTLEDDIKAIQKIGENAYYLNETVMHTVAELLLNQLNGKDAISNIGEQVLNHQNIGYLIELLTEKGNTCILVYDEAGEINYDVLGNMLSRLGQKVFLLVRKQLSEVESSLEQCLNNKEVYDDLTVISWTKENIISLIEYICKHECKDNLACIIGNGYVMDYLSVNMERGCEIDRLETMRTPVLQDKLTYGWAGDYLSYISRIYRQDIHEDFYAEPKYRFSIVIPTKDSADTLRHTIQTCLNQRWKGSYEILISDNSSIGNTAIYDLCQELNDERIHYYKTPRPLAIARSFEYAFLKTRGEFIIPLGADDGIMPWALEVLDEVLNGSSEEIFMWTRGQYQWPDYGAGISNQLVFPCAAEKGKYNIYAKEGMTFLSSILQEPGSMYGLPLLYINSGFRRSYMKTLLKKTGRLWDGPCQDIYTGVVNSIINKEIYMLNYPITMAGMAHCSTGATYTRVLDTIEKVNKRGRNKELGENSYIGAWVTSPVERLVPKFTSDVGLCYNSVIRTVAKKILPMECITQVFNMKKWYVDLFRLMNKQEYIYERQVKEMEYAAKMHGEEFYRWFKEDGLYANLLLEEECIPEELENESKKYEAGVYSDGTVVVDASEYGVENIYQAVLLAERISEY